jgi:hypothetical protein
MALAVYGCTHMGWQGTPRRAALELTALASLIGAVSFGCLAALKRIREQFP